MTSKHLKFLSFYDKDKETGGYKLCWWWLLVLFAVLASVVRSIETKSGWLSLVESNLEPEHTRAVENVTNDVNDQRNSFIKWTNTTLTIWPEGKCGSMDGQTDMKWKTNGKGRREKKVNDCGKWLARPTEMFGKANEFGKQALKCNFISVWNDQTGHFRNASELC